MIKSKVFFVHVHGEQWQQHSRVGNRPIEFALISTLCATEASNGMDVFFSGSHQINLYLSGFLFLHSTCHFLPCWSSDSCAFLVLLPSCCFLFLAFFPSVVSHPASFQFATSQFSSIFSVFSHWSKRRMPFSLGWRGEKIRLFFSLSKSHFFYTAVNSSPLHDALWLPPCCILSWDRIDNTLFHWKEHRAWKSCRFFIFFPIRSSHF